MSNTRKSPRAAWVGLAAAASLGSASGCAQSLSSQVSAVAQLAQTRGLPSLREGEVDGRTGPAVQKLLEQPLRADAAGRIALLNNAELRAQLRELGVPASQVVTAGLIANPTFELELLPERDSHYELRAEYDLTSLILAPLRRRAAQDELEAARLSTAAAVVEVGYQARARFYALQAAAQQHRLAQQSLEGLAAARDAAQALLDAGNVRPLEAAAQIAAFERASADVTKYGLALAERREELQRFMGLAENQSAWTIVEALTAAPAEPPRGDDIEAQALATNLDLRALKKRSDGLAKQSTVVRTQAWLPELDADVHALRVDSGGGDARGLWRWGAGVSLQVPLFDRKQGRLSGLDAQQGATLERVHGLSASLRSIARDARNRLVSAHARAHQYETTVLPAQRAVMQQTMLQYNAMQLGVFPLLAARRELLNTELTYVESLRDYWLARAELDALTRGRAVRRTESGGFAATTDSTEETGGH